MNACKLSLTTACLLLLCQSNSLLAGEWNGSDYKVTFNAPDPDSYNRSTTAPPILAKWEAKDGGINFVIKQKGLQPNVKVSQSMLEAEFIEEIDLIMKNGKLLDSTLQKRDGFNVFTMTGRGENGSTPIYFTQKVFARDEKNYLIVAAAVGIGTDTRTNADAAEFIDSVKVLAKNQIVQPSTATSSQHSELIKSKSQSEPLKSKPPENAVGNDFRLGYVVLRILILIVLVVLGVFRKSRNSNSTEVTGQPRKSW